MSVCRSSNLQGILSNAKLPQVKPLLEAFHKVADEDHRGTRLADETHHPPTKPPKSVGLADDVRAEIASFLNRKHRTRKYTNGQGRWSIPSTALILDKLSIRGVIYASEGALRRDSNIIFRRVGGSSHRVGKIVSIFSLLYAMPDASNPNLGSDTLLVIQEFALDEDEGAQWKYQQFGFAGGFLCRNQIVAVHLIGADEVVSHYAKTFFEQQESERFHVLPLNKVGISPPSLTFRTDLSFP